MERASSKVGPRLDEELKHETEGIVRSGHDPRAEEWKTSEPSGEDQPAVALRPELATEGPDHGLSAAEIELRSELASYIGRAYPLDRQALVTLLTERGASDQLVDLVAALSEGREFQNLQEVWEELGGSRENEPGR